MADSLLFQNKPDVDMPAVLVEGAHVPDALAGASGVYIAASGSAMLQNGVQNLRTMEHWLWLAVESGNLDLINEETTLSLRAGDCCMLPPGSRGVSLDVHQEARVLWIMVGGTLSGAFLQRMGALPHRIMKQGALPSQLNLAKHIVQATVRVAAAEDASSAQLQQLLWAMLASHSGQPVAMDAVLSHEIAKVVDAMRNAGGNLPQAVRFRSRYAAPELPALLQNGTGQGAAQGRLHRAPGRHRSGHERPLPLLQDLQEHRGHEPLRLQQDRPEIKHDDGFFTPSFP